MNVVKAVNVRSVIAKNADVVKKDVSAVKAANVAVRNAAALEVVAPVVDVPAAVVGLAVVAVDPALAVGAVEEVVSLRKSDTCCWEDVRDHPPSDSLSE